MSNSNLKLSVLMPYNKKNIHRHKSFNWVVKRYQTLWPGIELILQEDESDCFHKTKTLNRAFNRSTGDIIILADSDIFFSKNLIPAVLKTEFEWLLPYSIYKSLTPYSTDKILKQDVKFNIDKNEKEIVIKLELKNSVGGLVFLKREIYKQINGLDERFKGWGCEDTALATILTGMFGKSQRLNFSIYHLWHPKEKMKSIKDGTFQENKLLSLRYQDNMGDKEKLYHLTREWGNYDFES